MRLPAGNGSRDLLKRIDHLLGHLSLPASIAVLTGVTLFLAELLAWMIWAILYGDVPVAVFVVTAIVSSTVALPIILHAQRLIRALDQRKRELCALSNHLVLARNEAEAGNRAKTAFLANMSHELRTPLNAIIGFSDVLRSELFGPLGKERYQEYAEDIHSSGQHLLAIIDDILDLARIEAGHATMDEGKVDVKAILAASLRMMQGLADSRGITVDQRLSPQAICLWGSERMLRQVFVNLISNAVKYTPDGGHVTVGSRLSDKGELEVEIADTGIGMSPQDIILALQPFRRINNELSSRTKGTGLGLPLSKSMIEMHDGTLRIESAPSEGTSVTVRFPAERVTLTTLELLETS
jgi:signal transduction histidine kinase